MLWFQQDAPSLVQDLLLQAYGDDGTRIRATLPEKWSPRTGPVPMVTVSSDGVQRSANGTDRELVRVAVHADSLPRARALMAEIDAWLTTPKVETLFFAIHRGKGLGLRVGPNSLNGGFIAACTYAVGTTRRVSNFERKL